MMVLTHLYMHLHRDWMWLQIQTYFASPLSAVVAWGFVVWSQPEMGLTTPSLEMHIMHKVRTVNKRTQFCIIQHSEAAIWSPHCRHCCVLRIFTVSLPKDSIDQQVGSSRNWIFFYQEGSVKIEQAHRSFGYFLLRNNDNNLNSNSFNVFAFAFTDRMR